MLFKVLCQYQNLYFLKFPLNIVERRFLLWYDFVEEVTMLERKEEFKDRLTRAMDIRGIRAVDLAHRLGVSESAISQYRSGYAVPKSQRTADIAAILRVDPVWLMGMDVPMEVKQPRDLTPLDRDILNAYDRADPVTQANILLLLGVTNPSS